MQDNQTMERAPMISRRALAEFFVAAGITVLAQYAVVLVCRFVAHWILYYDDRLRASIQRPFSWACLALVIVVSAVLAWWAWRLARRSMSGSVVFGVLAPCWGALALWPLGGWRVVV